MRQPVQYYQLKSLIIGAALACALFGGAEPARAADEAASGGIGSTIERSALPAPEKETLAAAADRAIRSGIPAADVDAVVSRGIERGKGPAEIGACLDLAVKAQKEGLPTRQILSRIEQGFAKQVPQERIVAAVKRLAGHLASARPLVDDLIAKGVSPGHGTMREHAVETVARALERSIPADALSAAADRITERKGTLSLFERAVGTAADMVEFGVQAESAGDLVRQGLARGYREKDLDRMGQKVAENIRQGKSAEDVVNVLRQDVGRDRRNDRKGGGREGGMERRGDMGRGGRGR